MSLYRPANIFAQKKRSLVMDGGQPTSKYCPAQSGGTLSSMDSLAATLPLPFLPTLSRRTFRLHGITFSYARFWLSILPSVVSYLFS
jgi:hypothetical protein